MSPAGLFARVWPPRHAYAAAQLCKFGFWKSHRSGLGESRPMSALGQKQTFDTYLITLELGPISGFIWIRCFTIRSDWLIRWMEPFCHQTKKATLASFHSLKEFWRPVLFDGPNRPCDPV
jgi:hypothetical protein